MGERPEQDTQIFTEAAERFFAGVQSISPVDGSSDLAKVETSAGTFALRQWPRTTTVERVKLVQGVLDAAGDLVFVPSRASSKDGKPIEQVKRHLFDASVWIDGRPLRRPEFPRRLGRSIALPRNASTQTIDELTGAIAQFHEATRGLVTKRGTPSIPPGRLITVTRDTWSQQRQRLRPIASVTPDVQRWIRTGERAMPLAEKIIGALSDEEVPKLIIAHAHIWPEHVLVQREAGSERLVGIVDFKSVIASTPLLDLAQIATRFNGWSDESAEQVIGAYSDVTPLSPVERRVLPAVAVFDLIAETGRILIALHVELGSPNATEAVRDASDSMLRSLEAVTRTVERLEGINQPGPRKWVHRAPVQGKAPKSRESRSSKSKRPANPRGSSSG